MITIVDTPKAVDFCRNPFAFKVLGSNYKLITGGYAHWQVEKIDTIVAGDKISWVFNGETVTIEFKVSPDDSGNEIATVSSLSQILAGFKSNYYLDNAYTLTLSGAVLHGVAKLKGSAYNAVITITGTSFDEINPVVPALDVISPNYKILSKLYVEETYDSGTYAEAMETLSDVDGDGNAVVHINNKLRGFFTDVDLPAFNQGTITKCTETVKRYYAAFWEYYGAVPSAHKRYVSANLYAIDGLIPFNIYPGYDFISKLTTSKDYMSNAPAEIETWDTAQQYLYLFNWKIGTGTINMGIQIHYTDGTTYEDSFGGFAGAKQYEAFILPVGIPNLGLNDYEPTKVIDYYEVAVSIGTFVIGKTQKYRRVNKPFNNRVFLIGNDYNVLETLLAGDQQTELTVEKIITQRDLPYNYNVIRGELNADVLNDTTVYTVTTLSKTLAEIEHLRELLSNKHLYLQSTSNFLRCFILPDTFKVLDEAEDMHALSFQYRIANNKNTTLGSYDQSYNESYDIN